MKKCPQCRNLFNDELSFCLEDGTPLIEDLAPTVAFQSPSAMPANPAFVVDLSQKDEIPTQIAPFPPINNINQPKSGAKNYAVPLLIGLLLGGILVLATFFLIKNLGKDEKDKAIAINTNYNANPVHNSNSAVNTSNNTLIDNENVNSGNNSSKNTVNTNANTKRGDNGKYNGRVIMLNAYIRSAPDQYAPEVEVLPMDDRIVIGKRASPNSPWYRVTCEHGTKGWMHGNTIEFTK